MFKMILLRFIGATIGAFLGYLAAAIAVFFLGQVYGHYGATSVVITAFLITYPLGAVIGGLFIERILLHRQGPFLVWVLVSWLGGILIGLIGLALLDTIGGKLLIFLPVIVGCWFSLSYNALWLIGVGRRNGAERSCF